MADERPLIDRIRSHVGELCGVDPSTISDDGKLVAYGLDSVRAVELTLILEEELGIELSEHDPELARVETLRELADLVRRRREGGAP
jgi:acyl carrier protein